MKMLSDRDERELIKISIQLM